ncbi:family 2B encapsulin nanocompartment shell protein [Streptomyces sp. ISL-11]|uniref:family 2B encapsulin nanocompartment shell protein n=1 Tax=Streptomyces sp. ISL-11 TaxID=2819174 RepID=UPI001BEC9C3D|nr:family 2B encapsulin nanocompartment shell protein [Streptomyces sp. ISL-11]MBT2387554.1 cyclic nucleotide-binding domain-containing protein [Streptomyces sp. ISL-11]
MTTSVETGTDADNQHGPGSLSLGTAAARNLATTTKTVPQMQGITSRWLLRLLSWVHVPGGTYRVNRRLTHTLGDGRVEFVSTGADVRVIPAELGELPLLRGFSDPAVLEELAGRFTQHEYRPGDVLVEAGQPADQVVLIAHGKVHKEHEGEYGEPAVLGVLADGGYFGDRALAATEVGEWDFTVKAVTACTVLTLPRRDFEDMLGRSEELRSHVAGFRTASGRPQNEYGESAIDVASGHSGEPALPGVFADYELSPREYGLSVAQTVLRVHSRVADLYNEPMNQVEQQLRLTIEALRERQEHELVNNREFGLLHNADLKQRIHTRTGPPTPDDLDELLATVWKDPGFLLAHPRAIAAIGREFNRRGVYPDSVPVSGHMMPAWRGVPIFPCSKIPVTENGTSSILLMRTGEESQGVVGLHRTGIPDEYRPSLSVRFMGISEQAIISYLVSAYYSAAVLVPDALGILENVEVGH